jgi:hypothetical protein
MVGLNKIIIIFLFLSNICFSQSQLKTLNINLTGGYSDISGFIGGNVDIKQIGFDIGFSTISWEENNELYRKGIIGGGITYYLKGGEYEGYAVFHPYISMGYSYKSSYNTMTTSISPTGNTYELIWSDKFCIIGGIVINSKYSPFSCKLGLGYQISNSSPLAIDFVFKLRIFSKIYQ